MREYHNEIDPFAAQWLCELAARDLIGDGTVDCRDIKEVQPKDVAGFDACHFFAGIGVWSYSLRLARWPAGVTVWTGSCPCQPFSAAGKRKGFADDRHLWPEWFRLIRFCRPDVVLGEQVASADGLKWLDAVCDDLEGAGYAIGAVDTSSALTGAPHIRQRLRFAAVRVGFADRTGCVPRWQGGEAVGYGRAPVTAGRSRWMADAHGGDASAEREQRSGKHRQQPQDCGATIGMADADNAGPQGRFVRRHGTGERAVGPGGVELQGQPGPLNGFWRDADWLKCRDGRWRPVEPGTFPLVDGAPARVGRLRGYGNAVDAQATAVFVAAVIDAIKTERMR